jgi:hypothetical protein
MATIKIEAPEGYHWMDTAGGPALMVGDYTPHEGASAEYEFEVVESHDELELIEKPGPGKHSAAWDAIYEAILERTGNKQLAAATATARVGKQKDDPSTPAKPSERRTGSTRNPEGSAGGSRGGIELSDANIKALENLRDEHNERYTAEGKQADLGQLKAVFRRGAGAFSVSHRPSVGSRDQWALGRVKAFLDLLGTGKPKSAKYTGDNDLLPAEHPRSNKTEKRLLFVVSTPSGLDVARGKHLCGPSGERFSKSYLEPVGLKREQVDVIDLGELSDHQDDEPLAVIALGTAAREVLGKAADLSLPHPAAIRKAQHAEALERRISDLDELIEKVETSFLPPKGVQEAARRGLELRREHRRGGTAVGVARARDLANGRRVSISTIKRMVNYFVRHQKDMTVPKNRDRSAPGYPGAGRIAWLLWGGDSGQQWANTINERYEREREREKASKRVGIYKADESKRIVYGVVLDPYIIDAHDDYLSPAVIEETAHDFLSESRVVGLDHNGAADGAKVVESWIQPYPSPEDYKAAIEGKPHKAYAQSFGDDVVRSGSWVLGVKLTPELWSRVQSGELNGFSIGGYGQREDMAEGDMPEVEFIAQG